MSDTSTTGGTWGELFAGYSGRILVALSLGWFGVVTARLLLPPLLPAIIDDLGITVVAAGVMLSIMQGANAFALYPSGRLSDALGRATMIVPGLIVLSVSVVLIAVAPYYLLLVGAVAVLGLGAGLFTISSRALISDHFTDNRGRALGVYAAGFNVGGVLASALAAVAYEQWRLLFAGLAGLLAVITLVFVYWNREPYTARLSADDLAVRATVQRLVLTRKLQLLLLAYSLYYFVTRGFLGFFPAYLQSAKGLSPAQASAAFAVVFAVGAGSKILAGDFNDRFSRRTVTMASVLLAMGGLAGIVFAHSLWLLGVLIVLFAIGHQAQFPLIDAALMDAAPDSNVGGDLGAAKTVFFFVGSLGPTYVGATAQLFSYTVAFVGLVGMLIVSAALLFYGT